MKRKKHLSFDSLTDAQREAIFEECERVRPEDGEPLNAHDRQLHRQAGLKVGRPKIGRGAKRINISMEKGLLKTADTLARRKGMTRAGLIAESIKAYIAGAA